MKTNSIPIIGAGVGSGLNAKAASAGGADFIVTYSTAIYRTLGLPSMLSFLPYDNCNKLTLNVLPTIKACSGETFLLAGLGAHDPRDNLPFLLDHAFSAGAEGIANEPFIGSYGTFIKNMLDKEHLGFERELQMLKLSISKGKKALGWAFSEKECQIFAANGINIIGLMVDAPSKTESNKIIDDIQKKCNIIRKENFNTIILLHGKLFEQDSILENTLRKTDTDGYFTGSSLERYSVEKAIQDKVKYYKSINSK